MVSTPGQLDGTQANMRESWPIRQRAGQKVRMVGSILSGHGARLRLCHYTVEIRLQIPMRETVFYLYQLAIIVVVSTRFVAFYVLW